MEKKIDIKKSTERVRATMEIEGIKLNNIHLKRLEKIGKKEINADESIAKYIRRLARL